MSIDRLLAITEQITESGCWIYMGALNNSGYGPHRKIYRALRGPVSPTMQLDHKCRIRECVNPDHLRVVTPRENVHAEGSTSVAKSKAAQTHCVNGHELTPENVQIRSNGTRLCLPCNRRRKREGYYRHREKRLAAVKAYAQRKRQATP